MKKIGFLILLAFLSSTIYAQYNRPYRVAYNADKKSYLITNRGDGKVLEMDSNYKISSVITGLKDPRDLIVGSVGPNKGLLLIDDNKIVVYDASGYNRLIAFDVKKATGMDIEDIEVDPRDPQYFYLSDVGANRIIKGKVGQPPFYTPSFTTLVSSGLSRPKGLTFNSKNELLVVTDDTAGKIYKIDTASGKLTKYMETGLDSLNSIVQDNEGNYFITNWDDSYLYRCDKDFKNLKKLTSYNKPAGMVVNKDLDLLILLCHFCNKLEFHRLHYFEPSGTIGACPGDSLEVNFSVGAEGVGTYNSGNSFVVEMSDNSGSFAKPIVLGSVSQSVVPSSIKCKIPKGNYGYNHVYRIKSTSPEIISSSKTVNVFSAPDFSKVIDKWSLCKGSEVELGKSVLKNESGTWTPTKHLSNGNSTNPKFTASDTGTFTYLFKVTNTSFGCVDSIEIEVDVNPDIELTSLKKNIMTCKGTNVKIGVSTSPYSFTWSPSLSLSDSNSPNPEFMGNTSQRYMVNVVDSVTGCKGNDSVDVVVNSLPSINLQNSIIELCAGDLATFKVNSDTGLTYTWSSQLNLNDSNIKEPSFQSNAHGVYTYELSAVDMNLCKTKVMQTVDNHKIPVGELKELSGTGNPSVNNKISLFGTLPANSTAVLYLISSNDSVIPIDTFSKFPVVNYSLSSKNADTLYLDGFVKFISDKGCSSTSDTLSLRWVNVRNVFNSSLKLYPNPTSGLVKISSSSLRISSVKVISLQGVELQDNTFRVNQSSVLLRLDAYPPGLYIVEIVDEYGLVYQKKILKTE